MKITKAVITAAAPNQRTLPLQTLVDRDGARKSVILIIAQEVLRAGVDDIGIVIHPGDESAYRDALGELTAHVTYIPQATPRGYGHAVWCARGFVGDNAFLHMIGDHVYIATDEAGCAQQLVRAAQDHNCAISGVQATRENLLPYFGAVGGQRISGAKNLYTIERVVEKPTPTQAEQVLLVPGLRAGHYLCFDGVHVLTPTVMKLLDDRVQAPSADRIELSPILDEFAAHERYLALEAKALRYPVDVRYGLLTAQLALALNGQDRDEVLTILCELLAQRPTTQFAR